MSSGDESDPRIDVMVRKAGGIAELILNTEFLLGEYVAEFLKSDLEIYEMACELRLTPEQRCRLEREDSVPASGAVRAPQSVWVDVNLSQRNRVTNSEHQCS